MTLPTFLFFRRAVMCLALAAFSITTRADEPARTRRVVLVVWDGLRPDSVSVEATPTLAQLARDGVFFTRHHPVYPTMTEVNGTAIATGRYPANSGIIGNLEFRPAIDPLKLLGMEKLSAIRRGDELTAGKYLRVPTLPELLRHAGRRTVVAGTKGVAVLMDRAEREGDNASTGRENPSKVLFEGKTLPPELEGPIASALGGPFPTEIHYPNVEQDAWTTRALTDCLWPLDLRGLPDLTVLWMSDPDYTQHQFGPDSSQARRALASVDHDLAAVLKDLERRGLRDTTDVLVVSDHGFSTIGRQINVADLLTAGGFNATREFKETPKPGDVLVDGLNGSVFLYVTGHDAETTQRLVAFLQKSDFAGVIFTREPMPGTFALGAGHIDSPEAPDIVVALRWTDEKNAAGFPGLIVSDGGRRPGQGTHATLSRYDLHNTLVAAGPDFRRGWQDELPSGNVDVAPTIAHLLGLNDLPAMDGRVLSESLAEARGGSSTAAPATERMKAANNAWSQYLQVTHYGGVDYLDEGNGAVGAP